MINKACMCALLLVLSLWLCCEFLSLCILYEYLFVDPIDLNVYIMRVWVCVFASVRLCLLCVLCCRLFVYSYARTYNPNISFVRCMYRVVCSLCILFPFLFNSLFVLPFPFHSQIHVTIGSHEIGKRNLNASYTMPFARLFIVRAQANLTSYITEADFRLYFRWEELQLCVLEVANHIIGWCISLDMENILLWLC